MPRKIDDENRRADKVNPSESGVSTGNPQLAALGEGASGPSPRQRTSRKRGAVRAKPGARREP